MSFFSNPLKLHKKILKGGPGQKLLGGGGGKKSSGVSTGGPAQVMSRVAGSSERGNRGMGNGSRAAMLKQKFGPGKPGTGNTGIVPPGGMKTGGKLPARQAPVNRTGMNTVRPRGSRIK